MLIIKNKKAFTLVEILLWIIIVSLVMITAFQALTSLWIWKVRLVQKIETQKQVLYFSERLFEMIKYWWTIDYEEYFAREIRNNYNLTSDPISGSPYLSGHYLHSTGFWNFWITGQVWSSFYKSPPIPENNAEFYYCTSPDWWPSIGSGVCYQDSFDNGFPQAFGQYSFQFIDYNSNADSDWWLPWDENWDGNIIWDDDDEYLWEGPDVFDLWSNTVELYLLDWEKRERTFFRHNIWLDPNRPIGSSCDSLDGLTYTWSWCIWTIEYLKLEWKDWWMDHILWTNDQTEFDWVIDTWIIDPEFTELGTEIIAGSDTNNYWQTLFSDNINVTEFKVFPHPNIDTNRAWKNSNPEQNVAEYVRVQLSMMPSWKERKQIKGSPQEYKISTTINLTDIFTR